MDAATLVARSPEAVIGELVDDLAGSLGTLLVALGTRTGLWTALAGAGPLAPAELAGRTGVAEPLVREWCRAQAAGGYLTYLPDGETFALPDVVADALLRGPGLPMVDACTDMLRSLCADFDDIAAAFGAGDGFGWHRHGAMFWHGSDALTKVALPAELIGAMLDQLGPTTVALSAGGSAVDVGCGYGTPTLAVARHFPASRVLGVDSNDASVAYARQAAAEAGLADRVRFEVASATELPGSGYALATFFDSLHDLGDPVGALARVRHALASDGAVLLVEPSAADHVEDNLTPIGRMQYGVSTLVCTPNAVSQASEAAGGTFPLGTQAGEARLRDTAVAAGFTRVRRVPADAPLNLALELRP